MRNLKSPLFKNFISSLKSAFSPKTADSLPHVLFGTKTDISKKRDLIKPVFKTHGATFEQDLNNMFEYMTSTSFSFGAGFYSHKHPEKSLLTETVNTFFNHYGKPAGFESPVEFMEGISLFLSDRVKSRVVKAKPEESTAEETFSPEETALLESQREQLLSAFSTPENFSDPTYGFMFKIAHKEFTSCPLEKVKTFVSALEQDKKLQIKNWSDRIKELEVERVIASGRYKVESAHMPDRNIEYCKNILDYYKNVDVIESSFTFVRNKSLLRAPDNMLTYLVDKKVNTTPMQNDIALLQQVNNLLVCMQNGLLAKDVYFNGRNFVCQNPNYDRYPFVVGSALPVIEGLSNLSREKQSLLAYDESQIFDLLAKKKYPIAKETTTTPDGQTREVTLYSQTPIDKVEGLKQTTYPLFVKSFTSSQTDENAELMLFAVAGPDISLSTQICRVDKVPPVFRGDTSKHKQTSGEVIETNTHIHSYNLFDKVTNPTPQKSGHFDVAVNFNLGEQVSTEQLEAFFDNWCGIPTLDPTQTLLTQTEEFLQLVKPQTKPETVVAPQSQTTVAEFIELK